MVVGEGVVDEAPKPEDVDEGSEVGHDDEAVRVAAEELSLT